MLEQTAPRRVQLGIACAATAAVALAAIAVSWLVQPDYSSTVFGVELAGPELAYGRVKGAEDLLAAAGIGVFLLLRDIRGLVVVLAVGLLVPVGDIVAVVLAGMGGPGELVIHAGFLVVMASAIALLAGSWRKG